MASELVLILFYAAIFLYSVIIHEVSHGVVALWLGDATAKYSGRLNLNPLKHIDIWGSVVMPILMFLAFGIPFGWAKPVPYNPYNLKNQKWGPTLVALGGPLSNILTALLAVILAKMISIPTAVKMEIIKNLQNWSDLSYIISQSAGAIFFTLLVMVIFWNVILAFFNLIPIPPLDGSKLLFLIFDFKTKTLIFFENFGFVIVLLVILFLSGPLSAFLQAMLNLFLGQAI